MTHRMPVLICFVVCVLTTLGTSTHVGRLAAKDTVTADLVAGFRDPPRQARPSAYWLWLNGYVNRQHIERELKAFRDLGVDGVLIFDMGAQGALDRTPPAGPPFLGEQSVADIAYATQIAGKLGLDVPLSVASSWDMGGVWVKPRYASMGLFQSEIVVDGPTSVDQVLPFPAIPTKTPRRPDSKPAFLKDVAVLAIPANHRLPGYDFVFKLDPPGDHILAEAVLQNTPSDTPKTYGPFHLFTKDFSIAVSSTMPTGKAFREVLHASLLT